MATTETQRRLIPISDVCGELGGVSRSMVYELINQGLLIKCAIGRRSFVTAESLDAYIESLMPAAPPDPVQRD